MAMIMVATVKNPSIENTGVIHVVIERCLIARSASRSIPLSDFLANIRRSAARMSEAQGSIARGARQV